MDNVQSMSHAPLPQGEIKSQKLNEDAVYRKIAWRFLPFLMFIYILSYIDRGNVSFAYLRFKADVGLSDAAYGFGVSIFYLGYIIFEVPSNILLDKIGARLTLLRIMIFWGLVSSATAFITSPMQFYAIRVLLGVAEAGFFPGVILYLSYWFPSSRRASMTAFFAIALPLAGVVGGPISGSILNLFDNVWILKSWQWMFLIEGIPSVLMGVVTYFYLDDGPRTARWLTEEQKATVISNLEKERENRTPGHHLTKSVWILLLKDPKIYLASLAYFFNPWSASVLVSWGPSIVKQSGIQEPWVIGLLIMIPNIAGAAGMVAVGRSSDRRGERLLHFMCCMGLAAVSAILLALSHDQWLTAILLLSTFSIGYYGAFAVFWAIPPAFLSRAAAPVGIAIISSLGQSGGLLAAWTLGIMKSMTGNMAVGLYIVAAIEVIAGICVYFAFRSMPAGKKK